MHIFTSESVSEGHPDKVCDRISDVILDYYMKRDPAAKVAVETLVTSRRVVLAGEISSTIGIPNDIIESLARQAVRDIGYAQTEFHWQHFTLYNFLHGQSPDIRRGIEQPEEGAGDQGIMFGYASDETPDLMPAPIYYAHRILQSLAHARHNGLAPGIEPDAKSQVSLIYDGLTPVRASSIVVSTQHAEDMALSDIRDLVREHVVKTLPKGWMCADDQFFVNPTGRFVIGGPHGDTGLTGRKIIVDTYGGAVPHGGGAFSGKDPTKSDRSAAYAARYLAKNVIAAGLAKRCLIQLSYAIGVAHPISVHVNTYGTGLVDDEILANLLPRCMDLSPRGIRTTLDLNRPIYTVTSSYGHFGRNPTTDGMFPWEQCSLVETLHDKLEISGTSKKHLIHDVVPTVANM